MPFSVHPASFTSSINSLLLAAVAARLVLVSQSETESHAKGQEGRKRSTLTLKPAVKQRLVKKSLMSRPRERTEGRKPTRTGAKIVSDQLFLTDVVGLHD